MFTFLEHFKLRNYHIFLMRSKLKTERFRKLEYLYASIALLFGLIFVFLIPPGWNPDEPQHYWRVQQLTDGNIISDEFTNGKNGISVGGAIPTNSANFILSYGGYTATEDHTFRLDFPSWENKDVSVATKEGGELVNLEFSGSARYSPVVYAPQIVGVWLAEKLDLSLFQGFILAKIFALVTQVTCLFWAIKLIPRGKWALFTIGLLPSTVVQSAAFGGDVMTTSACVLFIALVIKMCYIATRPSYMLLGLLFLLLAIISLVKPAYLPLGVILILLPICQSAYRNKKSLLTLLGFGTLAVLPGILWLSVTSFIKDNYGPLVKPVLQKEYVLQHPLEFINALFQTYFTDAQPRVLKTLFGNFVWDTAPLPLIFMFIGVIVLVLALFVSSYREKGVTMQLSTWARIVLFGTFIGLVTLISAGLYVFYTDYKLTSIAGIQARYFIPFLILPMLALLAPLPTKNQRVVKGVIISSLLSMLIAAVMVIIYRVYL